MSLLDHLLVPVALVIVGMDFLATVRKSSSTRYFISSCFVIF